MGSCEKNEFAAVDDYIRAQLTRAAEAYASHADIDARLKAVLETGEASD
jgi:hypothetical protein